MEMIPIAGAVLAFIGLVMMVVAVVMYARGGNRQVKVVIPTSTAGKMPPAPPKAESKAATPPPPPAPPRPEPPKAAPPPPPAPRPEPPKAAAPPPPPPAPPPPAMVLNVDPDVSEEGTRIAMIPAPEPIAPLPPPPPSPDEATVSQPIPTAPAPPSPPEEEQPQSTMAISAGDMSDFRTVVEQAAPKSYGSLVGISGGMQGREARIDEEGFVIGRDQKTAQLVISDPRISKRHVWIGVREGEVWAIDVGSTNGTYLNVPRSERITEVRLKPGDVLILSEDAARFEYRK